jgi:hypothetical protein
MVDANKADFLGGSGREIIMNVKAPPPRTPAEQLAQMNAKIAAAPAGTARRILENARTAFLKNNPDLARIEQARREQELQRSAARVATIHAAPGGYNDTRAADYAATMRLHNQIASAPWNKAKVDWGLLPAAAAVIAGGVAVIVTAGAAGAAIGGLAAGGASLGSVATAGTSILATGAAANEFLKTTTGKSVPGVNQANAIAQGVPGAVAAGTLISQDPGAALSASLTADRLLAVSQRVGAPGAAEAAQFIADARKLARDGVPGAAEAAAVFDRVAAERTRLKIPAGALQTLSASNQRVLSRVVDEAGKVSSALRSSGAAGAAMAGRAEALLTALQSASLPYSGTPAPAKAATNHAAVIKAGETAGAAKMAANAAAHKAEMDVAAARIAEKRAAAAAKQADAAPLPSVVPPTPTVRGILINLNSKRLDLTSRNYRGVSAPTAGSSEGVVLVTEPDRFGRLDMSTRHWVIA